MSELQEEHASKFYGEIGRLESENSSLRNAIKWALGERGDFAHRRKDEGAYWWRTELRQRATLDGGKQEILNKIAESEINPNDPRLAKPMTEEEIRNSNIRLGDGGKALL